MSDPPVVQYASRTDIGMRRAANQDSLVVRLCSEYGEWLQYGHLFVVSDGMGGHAVGDLASRISVEALPLAYLKADAESIPQRLKTALSDANRAINDKARENPEFADMGTTCSSLVLTASGAFVGHVGDSRVYRVRDGVIEQLTFDHSLQWEMIRQGRATMANVDLLHPRNVITRCLGPDRNVEIDIEGPFQVLPGDHFVICSDGLTGHLTDSEIGAIASSLPPSEATRLLIDVANCRGGGDNITVIVARIDKYPGHAGPFIDNPGKRLNPKPTATRQSRSVKTLASRWSLFAFLLLGTLGLVLLALKKIPIGLMLICPALILGFIRMMLVTGHTPDGASSSSGDSGATQEMPVPSRPALKSPYRTASAEVQNDILEFLAEAQSELTQAARDNGWDVDFSRLGDAGRKATAAYQEQDLAGCIALRARAIDELMKELYSQARRH